jgi:hypothetical protein
VRTVTFTKAERQRIAEHCQALGITFGEFIRWATLQAVDEMDGVQRELRK